MKLTATIELYRDEEKVDSTRVTGDNSYSFKGLAKYDLTDGHIYSYTVKEVPVDGYTLTSEVENQTNGKDFTNTINQDYVNIEGTKTWVVPSEMTVMPDITINLYQNVVEGDITSGTEVYKTVTLKNGTTKYEFKDLPKYQTDKDGKYILDLNGSVKSNLYVVKEEAVDKFTTTMNNYDITNTYNIPTGNITKSWTSQETTQEQVPVDVVFVLDTSLSMIQYGSTRGETMVNAVNSAISDILSFNSHNRVSVVGFSEYGILNDVGVSYSNTTDTTLLLELGRYNPDNNNKYLVKNGNALTTSVDEKSGAQITRYFDGGTYTQAGIKLGAQQLINNNDITANINGKTVKRIPVIILVSDGEPTAFNADYDDLAANTKCGSAQLANTTAAYGYYTILTANYYKQQVTSHYQMENNTSAKFFTIAMDLGSHYGRTTLNPNSTNVNTCNGYTETITYISNTGISNDLYNYLNLQTGTTSTWYNTNNEVQSTISIIANPYRTTGYSYVDRAFTNSMTSEELRSAIITSIVETVPHSTSWAITAAERVACKAYLPGIDTTLNGFNITAGSVTYTSCSAAIADGVVASDTKGYYLDLAKLPAGTTVTVTYKQN